MDISNIPLVIAKLQEVGLTQTQIAKDIGCGQSTISDILRKKAGHVRPTYAIVSGLERLAKKHKIKI